MSLFNSGSFTLHSGAASRFLIDCDALTDSDLAAIAEQIAISVPPFRSTVGVPRGGLRLAAALTQWRQETGSVLIVDDVLTTGTSMEEMRQQVGDDCFGVVAFARGSVPDWVWPLFAMSPVGLRDGRTG